MSQSYNKPCRDCKQQITMMEMNGRWGAYNTDGSGFHTCKQQQKQPLTIEERVAKLEKAVFGK